MKNIDSNNNQLQCNCGSGEAFALCCQPFLLGQATAATPEELMRSRYSAFCTGNIDYLIATHHPSKRKPDDRTRLAQSVVETEWLGLRVLESSAVRDSRQRGFVEFVAFYREKLFSTERDSAKRDLAKRDLAKPELAKQAAQSAAQAAATAPSQLREKSEFIKEDGKWYYVQGLNLPPIKITRNDPCWCGSGKKLKQCHGRSA